MLDYILCDFVFPLFSQQSTTLKKSWFHKDDYFKSMLLSEHSTVI